VRWIRNLLRELADEGRTVLLSSHLLSEVSVTADHLIVIQNGRLVADCPTEQLMNEEAAAVVVVAPERDRLRDVLAGAGGVVDVRDVDTVIVNGLTSAQIGEIALRSKLVLHQLTPQQASLEDAFLELTESFGRTA
jgi:ABC-2 type transport system ATP-binding protein